MSPPACASPSAIGVTAVTVPTEVPVEMEMNADITKTPAAMNCGGMKVIPRFTTESTPPIAEETDVNAPANKKDHTHDHDIFFSTTVKENR